MAASRMTGRYQREQRITAIGWATVVLTVTVVAVAYHYRSTSHSASSDGDAAPPITPTLTMHAWLDQSKPSIHDVVSTRNKIAAAASRQDIPATGTACMVAAGAVENLRDHMPSPEATVNQPLQQAISSYTVGLPECVSAAQAEGGEGMQKAARFISEGDGAMQLALDNLADEPGAQPGSLGVLIV